MRTRKHRAVGILLIVVLVAMQAANAWAMPMGLHASGALAPAAMEHDAHGMTHSHAVGAPEATTGDSGCDSQTTGDCASCAHCIAVFTTCGAAMNTVSLPYVDRIAPSVSSLKLVHFRPPRAV